MTTLDLDGSAAGIESGACPRWPQHLIGIQSVPEGPGRVCVVPERNPNHRGASGGAVQSIT
eukprot:scaffold114783_cov69-Phaeocystis_antarctica.AAC.2